MNLTVRPGRYAVKLLFADTAGGLRVTASINGREVLRGMDVAREAGGPFRALERSFAGIEPPAGVIEVSFAGSEGKEAAVQAIELTPE